MDAHDDFSLLAQRGDGLLDGPFMLCDRPEVSPDLPQRAVALPPARERSSHTGTPPGRPGLGLNLRTIQQDDELFRGCSRRVTTRLPNSGCFS